MNFLEWLNSIKASIPIVGADQAMRNYVAGLHARDKLYHFDETAHDIIFSDEGKSVTAFTKEEANLLDEITGELYCGEMFNLAFRLVFPDGVDL